MLTKIKIKKFNIYLKKKIIDSWIFSLNKLIKKKIIKKKLINLKKFRKLIIYIIWKLNIYIIHITLINID